MTATPWISPRKAAHLDNAARFAHHEDMAEINALYFEDLMFVTDIKHNRWNDRGELDFGFSLPPEPPLVPGHLVA